GLLGVVVRASPFLWQLTGEPLWVLCPPEAPSDRCKERLRSTAAMARQLMPVPSSQKALLLELKGLQEEPVEGFRVTLVDEGDLYNWEVAIFGPPSTFYEEGYFKAQLKFPIDYPYSPPTFRFLTKMWHPNIYENGDVCISILHPPVDDPQSEESFLLNGGTLLKMCEQFFSV
ncbi:unnamed protein product, partial [Staurois parvus]